MDTTRAPGELEEPRAVVERLALALEDRDLSDPALVVSHAVALLATAASTDPRLRCHLGPGCDALARTRPAVAAGIAELMSAYWTVVLRKLDDRDLGRRERARTVRWLTFVHFVTVTSLVGHPDPELNEALATTAAELRRHAARPLFGALS